MNILITGIGGPTPRSIAHTLRMKFPDAKLIGVDANPKAIGFYIEGLLDESMVIPRANDDRYWEAIIKIIAEHQIDIAFVQPEFEVMAWGRFLKENGQFPCPVMIPPLEHTNALMNKARMADILKGTHFIPNTITLTRDNGNINWVEKEIGFPCWIRAAIGSGGLGSLTIHSKEELDAWLFIHKEISEFTVSEFLTGRHLANQMMYIDGEMIKNAGLHCVEYVMADVAPSKVTGNTSFGRFINENPFLAFCEEVMIYIQKQTQTPAHGIYSFDIKEDKRGYLKVTEINIRHMAYTGLMADVGFDLVGDTIHYLTGNQDKIEMGRYRYKDNYIFLRDVDERPLLLKELNMQKKQAIISNLSST